MRANITYLVGVDNETVHVLQTCCLGRREPNVDVLHVGAELFVRKDDLRVHDVQVLRRFSEG